MNGMHGDFKLVADVLKLGGKAMEKAGNIQRVSSFDYPYYRFRQKTDGIEKGTVVFIANGKAEVFSAFPKTKRIISLEAGIKKHFKGGFAVEEKLDGYNVRVAKAGGNLVAITRGGMVCPYTTYKIRKILGGNSFFDENPELMLCGEVVGLQNPYQEKSYPESKNFGYYVFDIRRKRDGAPLTIAEKKAMLEKYGIAPVPEFGAFGAEQWRDVLSIVEKLGSEKREGIVMKSLDMSVGLKYTCNSSTNNDLKYAFEFWSDYGQAFFFRRIIREAFQCHEFCMDEKAVKETAHRLGESIMLPLVRTIRRISEGEEVTEDFDIVVPDREFGGAFVDHLNRMGAKVTVRETVDDAKGVLMRLSRQYQSTNDSTRAYLEGSTWSD